MADGLIVSALIATVFILGIILWIRSQKRSGAPSDPEPPRLAPAGDAEIFLQVQGEGEALVLLHGIGASSFTFRLIAAELAKDYKVINLDLPGFGQSSSDTGLDYGLDAQSERLIKLLDHLQIPKAYLLGSSMGGALALWLGRIHPERFPKIMALAPATEPTRVWAGPRLLSWVTPLAPHLYSKALLSQLYQRVVSTRELVTQEAIDGYHRPYQDPQKVVTFLKATHLLKDPRLPLGLEGLKSEVEILYGAQDKVVRRHDVERLLRVLPLADYEVHPTAGHHIQEDDPAWVIERARKFFGSVRVSSI